MERVGGAFFRLAESLVDPVSVLITLFALMVWFRDDLLTALNFRTNLVSTF